MQLNDVIGLQETKNQLVQMLHQNRLSHAILLLGKEGTGALPLAIAFAAYVVAQEASTPPPSASKNPSATLQNLFGDTDAAQPNTPATAPLHQSNPALLKAAKLLHPDIHYSFPTIADDKKKKKNSNDYMPEWRNFIKQTPYGNVYDWLQFINAENKQGNITAEECNEIGKILSLKSFESQWKILIMWMPEYLGKNGNKLLKLIEEPPPDTLILLVAENEEAILPTILSRCQTIRLPMPTNAEIETALVTHHYADPQRAQQIALMAEGNYHEALHLLESNDEDWQSLLRQWLNAAIKGTPKMQMDWIQEMNDLKREKQKQFLKYFVHLLELSIRIRILGTHTLALPEAEKDFAQRLNKIASIAQQEALAIELENAIYYIERNANAKMLFQALTLKLRSIVLEKTILLANV